MENLEKGDGLENHGLPGGMLNIKPVLTIEERVVLLLKKSEQREALERLVEIARICQYHGNVRCIIAHANVLEEALKIMKGSVRNCNARNLSLQISVLL